MAYKSVQQIKVPHGQSLKLAKHFGVTIQTVRNALKFIYESELAASIRKEAIENYGGKKVTLNEKTY